MKDEMLNRANNLKRSMDSVENELQTLEQEVVMYNHHRVFEVLVDTELRDTIYTLIKANKEAELKKLEEEFERL